VGGQVIKAQMGQHPKTQAPDIALDNETEVDAQFNVLAESHMQQQASKRTIAFEVTE
jgi:hypothetical protein